MNKEELLHSAEEHGKRYDMINEIKRITLETQKWENTNQESMYRSMDDIYREAYQKVMNV